MEEASVIRQGHTRVESLPHHQSLIKASKRSIKGYTYNHLTFLELMTTPLTTIQTEVLAVIQRKEFVQYPSPMKRNTNTRNSNKLCLFHHDNKHDTKKCHTFKKEIE
jgi:hypothetical protein